MRRVAALGLGECEPETYQTGVRMQLGRLIIGMIDEEADVRRFRRSRYSQFKLLQRLSVAARVDQVQNQFRQNLRFLTSAEASNNWLLTCWGLTRSRNLFR